MSDAYDVRVMFANTLDASTPTRTIVFRIDETKAKKIIRSTTGDVGRVLRLLRIGDGRVSRACDHAMVDVRGVRFDRTIAPALRTVTDARESTQRQLGALRDGCAVQLRFGHVDAGDDTIEVIDGALTLDPLNPSMEACVEALGDVLIESARALGTRAGSVGKNPRVWTPRKLDEEDNGYVPGKVKYESAWKPDKFKADLESYQGLQGEADPLLRKMESQERHARGLEMRITNLEIIQRGLREGVAGVIAEDSLTRRVVDAELVDEIHAKLALQNDVTGEIFNLARDCGVYFDDIEGCDASEIEQKAAETYTQLEICRTILSAMSAELQERVMWENYESGVETRDVLENGVRREHMEYLLGRPATKADVDASLRLPDRLRAKLVGGYDVERSKAHGKYIAAARSGSHALLN